MKKKLCISKNTLNKTLVLDPSSKTGPYPSDLQAARRSFKVSIGVSNTGTAKKDVNVPE